MAPSLRFSSLVLLAMSWMLAAGCSDSDSIMVASGGSSGHGGSSGAGAHAGSAGKAGGSHAGAAGEAGEAGSSGTGAASGSGDAGSAGAAGEAGAPVSGGTGGSSGGTGGTSGGGTGGTSGGGTGGVAGGGAGGIAGGGGAAPIAVKNCNYQCATDDDCKTTIPEDPQTHFCHPTRKRCEDISVCQVSSDCVAFANQFSWFFPCVNDADCSPGTEACVPFGHGGLCAPLPDAQTGCADGVLTQLPHFGATGNVQVCASPGVCVNKACQFSCASDNGGCTDGTQCNASTGLCECSASTQCKAASGKPVCGATSHCECATSDQCTPTASVGLDKCYSGSCGCSNAAACPASPYVNATPVCE
jgi:hypothetical protein